ncbi:MAG: phage head morphogenesis protein [Oscillospiraceae bacterium]|nr:phage head morphogenesis protein [Oscillospiraceae bacterium]
MVKDVRISRIDNWVMWKSENSTSTCRNCAERDGKFFRKGTVEPPLHPNCKCRLVPLTKSLLSETSETSGTSENSAVTSAPFTEEPAVSVPRGGYVEKSDSPIEADSRPRTVSEARNGVSTSAPVTEQVGETVPGGVYAYVDENLPFTGGTLSIVSGLLNGVIRLVNTFLFNFNKNYQYSSIENYLNNQDLSFDGLIYNQEIGPASRIIMGIGTDGDNACGWVAAYNAFITLGIDVHPAEIVKYFENNNGLINNGEFGVNPLVYDDFFERHGLKSTTTLFEDAFKIVENLEVLAMSVNSLPSSALPSSTNVDLDELAKQGDALILAYWNDKKDAFKGAHYISIKWDEESGFYTTWNTSVDTETFESIYDYLGSKRGLISMTVVY